MAKALKRRFPGQFERSTLTDIVGAVRRGEGLGKSQKLLIVLDQFEQWLHDKRQWLHARREEDGEPELVRALLQCDGERVQCILLVREDFWGSLDSFMGAIKTPLITRAVGENVCRLPFFSQDAALNVLIAFGQAEKRLPEDSDKLSFDQKAFLDQAVKDLAPDGNFLPVQLALLAQMMRNKPWTPATLREVGGTKGVGSIFLEETFSSPRADPRLHAHEKAAQGVLKALLPETGSDIRGHMRSHQDLLAASAYVRRPSDFEALLRILDEELRLITPADPEGVNGESQQGQAVDGGKYYQLTHDYLVHSLRDWLTRKQRETRRGRAELRLAERAALWQNKPENRHLPAWWEWANIRLFTRKKDWTPSQRKMMRRAGRYHGVRGVALVLVLLLLSWIGYEVYGRLRADFLVESIVSAETADVPRLVEQLPPCRHWADDRLRRRVREAPDDSKEHLNASLALVPVDPGQVDYLYGRLLDADPKDVAVIRDALQPYKGQLVEKLWAVVEHPAKDHKGQPLRAACALAGYDVTDDDANRQRWQAVSPVIADRLLAAVQQNPSRYDPLLKLLRPVRDRLVSPLSEVFRSGVRPPEDRSWATSILADYAADDLQVLADLLMDADEKQFAVIFAPFKAQREKGVALLAAEIDKKLLPDLPSSDEKREKLAKRQANAAVALLRLNQPQKV